MKLELIQNYRCIGSYGTLGFCTAAGQAGFADNGGKEYAASKAFEDIAHTP